MSKIPKNLENFGNKDRNFIPIKCHDSVIRGKVRSEATLIILFDDVCVIREDFSATRIVIKNSVRVAHCSAHSVLYFSIYFSVDYTWRLIKVASKKLNDHDFIMQMKDK